MTYIATKRFKRLAQCGESLNIPYGTKIEESGGVLYHKGKAVCSDRSAVMRVYFARNDDGMGKERGKLTTAIMAALNEGDEQDALWQACWEDEICLKYRKDAQADHFLWDISFYNAGIEDLQHIAALVGAKVETEAS